METTQTTEAAVAQPSETQPTEVVKTPQDGTQPKAEAKGGEDAGAKVHRLLELGKKNPGHKYTDEELDFLDTEYHSGKTKPTKPLSVEKEEPETGETEPEAKTEESEENESTEEKRPKVSKEIEDAMKDVGAKTPEELPAKIKALRKQLSGKDAQAVATLTKEKGDLERRVQSEIKLIQDLKAGVPEAIQHFEQAYGLKIAQPGQAQPQTQTQDQKPFTDDDDALVGGALSKMWDALQAQQKNVGGLQESYQQAQQRIREEQADIQAKNMTTDEILTVASGFPEIAGIQNLRGVVAEWVNNGKEDSRLAPLNELLEIATRDGVSLTVAAKIKKADEAEKLIAAAEAKGRESAYKHKPNPSLSGVTGGKGETPHYTEDQINEMVNDHTKHPADWYDKDDNLIESKIPAKWRSRFGF